MTRSLLEVRRDLDAVDGEIAVLLRRRMELVDEVARAKRASGASLVDRGREGEILERMASIAGAEFAGDVQAVYAAIFESSKARQRRFLQEAAK